MSGHSWSNGSFIHLWTETYILSMDCAAYLVPGVDLVTCVNNAWLLLTVVWLLGAGWRFSPMLTVRTWFTGPWRDRGSGGDVHPSTSGFRFPVLKLDSMTVGSLMCIFSNRSTQIRFYSWSFYWLVVLFFPVRDVSASSLSPLTVSPDQLWFQTTARASETLCYSYPSPISYRL